MQNQDVIQPQSYVVCSTRCAWQFRPDKVLLSPAIRTRLGQKRNVAKKYPIAAEIHLTSICNLACTYCSYAHRNRQISSLSLQEVISIISWCASSGTEGILFSGGGEPLSWPHWRKLSEWTITKNNLPHISIATNALELERQLSIDFLRTLTIIQVSFHGYSKDSIAKRTKRDVFRQFTKSLDFLFKYKGSNVQCTAKIVLDAGNAFKWQDYIRFAARWPFDAVVVKVAGAFEQARRLSLNSDQRRQLALVLRGFSWPRQLTHQLTDLDSSPGGLLNGHTQECSIVAWGLYALVRSDGDVFLCVASADDPKGSIGNVKESSVESIWSSQYHLDVIAYLQSKCRGGHCRFEVCRHIKYAPFLKSEISVHDAPQRLSLL